jgi:NAD(P)-dependent dehydrogenase (short-subunit alcohol dehydrogenase family)
MTTGITYQGKRVVVTGAASGMGDAVARLCSALGAEVIGLDVRPIAAPVARRIEVNLQDEASIDRAVEAVTRPGGTVGSGRVDALFNCAGVPGPPFSSVDTMLINFIGTRHLTEGLLVGMQAGAAVVSVASVAGMGYLRNLAQASTLVGIPDFAAARRWCEEHPNVAQGYAFAKECVIVYTMRRVKELGARGIRINCTSPGVTDTPMLGQIYGLVGKDWIDRHMLGCLGRAATPVEQAWPLVFLNSDLASYVSGANWLVDGGYSGAVMTGQIEPPPPPAPRAAGTS